jgi:F0F1-type ATP synthase epsilon subunit
MADKPFRCRLITPDARIFDAKAAYASVPMWDGKIGVMAGAGALVGKLGAGELRIEFVDRYEVGVKLEESGHKSWFIDGGFMQNVNNELTILAAKAIEADTVTEAQARAEVDAANAKSSLNPLEMDRITHDRQVAMAKLAMVHARA